MGEQGVAGCREGRPVPQPGLFTLGPLILFRSDICASTICGHPGTWVVVIQQCMFYADSSYPAPKNQPCEPWPGNWATTGTGEGIWGCGSVGLVLA